MRYQKDKTGQRDSHLMHKPAKAAISRRTMLLFAIIILGSTQCWQQAGYANNTDLSFAKDRLSRQIIMAKKQGINTERYQRALHNIKLDINATEHSDDLTAQLKSLSKELEKKMDVSERAPEGSKYHVGLQLGFSGKAPTEGTDLNTYLSSKISDDIPLVVKGFWVNGSSFNSGLKVGDRILAINGSSINGLTIQQALDKLLGEANTRVSIGFQSASDKRHAKTIMLLRTTKALLKPL